MPFGGAWASPYLNQFTQPDTIVSNPYNPQGWNRYSYVVNNPIRYNDPTGHVCTDPDDLWSPSCSGGGGPPPNTPAPLPPAPVIITNPDPLDDGLRIDDDCDCGVPLSPVEDTYTPSPLAIAGTLLDGTAGLLNAGYAIVGDLIGLACQACYLEVLWFYQTFSIIPNSISTIAMAFWIADGVVKGENKLTFSQTSAGFSMSLSVSQDTLVSVVTNALGWTVLRDPNAATGADLAVLAYDVAGLGIPGTNLRLPTFINPTVTYTTETGLDFSWQQK